MAKAQFHKNQRVFVKPIGTWALVERVVPHWTKGLEEPIRVLYDVGLGRDFGADELQADPEHMKSAVEDGDNWRVVRARNRWQSDQETTAHPFPGTYPVVVTSETEWGGWRVPGSEYALSPARVEKQARLLASSPRLASIVRQLAEWGTKSPENVPEALNELLRACREAIGRLDSETE
jgi:hypothetical protein